MATVKQFIRPDAEPVLGNCIGELVKVTDAGVALVDFPQNNRGPVPARSVLGEGDPSDLGPLPVKVLLVFEDNEPQQPIITGLVHDKLFSPADETDEKILPVDRPNNAIIDGKKLEFNAKDEILFKCGKSSILLRKDGKVVIKGVQLLSRASGSNKIKGSSVNIN